MNILKDIESTLNPKKGGGMEQSIIYVILILSIVFLRFNDIDVPGEFYLGMGALLGYITDKSRLKGEKED